MFSKKNPENQTWLSCSFIINIKKIAICFKTSRRILSLSNRVWLLSFVGTWFQPPRIYPSSHLFTVQLQYNRSEVTYVSYSQCLNHEANPPSSCCVPSNSSPGTCTHLSQEPLVPEFASGWQRHGQTSGLTWVQTGSIHPQSLWIPLPQQK